MSHGKDFIKKFHENKKECDLCAKSIEIFFDANNNSALEYEKVVRN